MQVCVRVRVRVRDFFLLGSSLFDLDLFVFSVEQTYLAEYGCFWLRRP